MMCPRKIMCFPKHLRIQSLGFLILLLLTAYSEWACPWLSIFPNAKLVFVSQVWYLEAITLELVPHNQAQSRNVAQEQNEVNNTQGQHLVGTLPIFTSLRESIEMGED
ncbi:hypothetical protein RRG08_016726 [Elysia crispata]|uniref:Uncharacterized protein n=1 Tax=Elysia crispata TaxID=231223 RepID=A0AAE1D2Y5_9GAST|nr:hypothetical protein RRG08_016726 [Elysia crispata]